MRIFVMIAACAISLTILAALPRTAAAAGGVSQDQALLAAHDAFLAGDKAKLAGRSEKVRGHVLESYVDFWGIQLRMEEAAPTEVQDFLARNAGTVLAGQLRRDWLRVLGRTGQWALFSQERPALVKDDPDVTCYTLQARWRRQDGPVLAGLKPFWNTPKALPDGCEPVADALLRSGALSQRDLRDRFRLLVRANLMTEARQLSERWQENQLPRSGQIDSVAKAPARFLEGSAIDVKTAPGRELVIVALSRLAPGDPQAAFDRWDGRLQKSFPIEDQQYIWVILAVHGARHGLPQALDWFRKAGEMPFSDEQLAWRTRIALRQKNWPEVRNAIGRMSPPMRLDTAWTYWLGRSLCELGAVDDGRKYLNRIAAEYDFYGRLAAEDLGRPLKIPPQSLPPTREELAGIASLPGLERALALYRLGLRTEGTREWEWTIRALDDRTLLAAAEVARRNKLWDRAISTADRTVAVHDFTLRYPAPYRSVISRQARQRHLDEPWVFGLVRQESRFMAEARSPVGAAGLMQLMPSTASRVARKIGMKGFRPSRVNRPEVNAALGTAYLRSMLDAFDGSLVLAGAAYNAGPGRARRWRSVTPLEGAIYAETIPFAETRQYVKKVMANTVYYAALFGGEQHSLKARLGIIAGTMPIKERAGGSGR